MITLETFLEAPRVYTHIHACFVLLMVQDREASDTVWNISNEQEVLIAGGDCVVQATGPTTPPT